MTKSRMFDLVSKTWNPVIGCHHRCRYCWAIKLTNTRLKHIYNDFKPKIIPKRLGKIPKSGLIFVSDMGDLFGEWVPDKWIRKIFTEIIYSGSRATFLFLTKNPTRYHRYLKYYRRNMLFGATIESNIPYPDLYKGKYKPPSLYQRYSAMKNLPENVRKFLSIEPILDFNHNRFLRWITEINPEIIYIGYDNYNNRLPEPRIAKVEKLKNELIRLGYVVRVKTMRKAWYEQ